MSNVSISPDSYDSFDESKLVTSELYKKLDHPKAPYCRAKLKYAGKAYTSLCPPDMPSSGIKHSVMGGKDLYNVTVMHDTNEEENPENAELHKQHIMFRQKEFERVLELSAEALIALEGDKAASTALGLSKWKAKLVKKDKSAWTKEKLMEELKDSEIIRPVCFQVEIDGSPIERAEERPAMRMKVAHVNSFLNPEHVSLATKLFRPRKASEMTAERLKIDENIGVPFTGNVKVRLPWIHIGKGDGIQPRVSPNFTIASIVNLKPREAFDGGNDGADDFVAADEEYAEADALFAQHRERVAQKQELGEESPEGNEGVDEGIA